MYNNYIIMQKNYTSRYFFAIKMAEAEEKEVNVETANLVIRKNLPDELKEWVSKNLIPEPVMISKT